MPSKSAVILYNKLSKNAKADEADVLDQVNLVSEAFTKLGYTSTAIPFSIKIKKAAKAIQAANPDVVFNLVESINNNGSLLYFSPAYLDTLGIPYTGSHTEAMFVTTNKVLAKKILLAAGLPTAPWFKPSDFDAAPNKRYILKPIWEEGSLGLDEHSVFDGNNLAAIEKAKQHSNETHYIEEFIDGREFNISILASENGPVVMPPAEIQFIDFPAGKPKVVGYTAKWIEDSFEYKNTQRTFDFPKSDVPLLAKLVDLCAKTWNELNLRGYARVDFRVDKNNNPLILEVNANPCISPDSGFVAACGRAGIETTEMVRRIVADAEKTTQQQETTNHDNKAINKKNCAPIGY